MAPGKLAPQIPDWRFVLSWVVAVTIGHTAGQMVAKMFAPQDDSLLFYPLAILSAIVIGGAIGLAQSWILRSWGYRFRHWTLASSLGWTIGAVISLGAIQLANDAWLAMGLPFVGAGTGLAAAQWILLRRRVQHAGWWVGMNVLALIIGSGALMLLVNLALSGYDLSRFSNLFGGVLLLTWIITGMVLAGLLKHPLPFDQSSVTGTQ